MSKMIVLYVLGGITGILILLFIIGMLLPAERIVSRRGHFNASPEMLYGIVTNNNDWRYRTSLKDLVILNNDNGIETWDEVSKNGTVIRFRTREKKPYTFYSFNMEAEMFTGYWTGEFATDNNEGTIFIATEYIKVKNPLVKTFSYLFFDVGKLMDEYQNDLKQKVNAMNKNYPQ